MSQHSFICGCVYACLVTKSAPGNRTVDLDYFLLRNGKEKVTALFLVSVCVPNNTFILKLLTNFLQTKGELRCCLVMNQRTARRNGRF
jgi:hypothetical protein